MNWMLDIIITHRRLRGLTEQQLTDLIEAARDIETLRVLKEHVESGDFRYPHLEAKVPDMLQRITERAKHLLWEEKVDELKLKFMEAVQPW